VPLLPRSSLGVVSNVLAVPFDAGQGVALGPNVPLVAIGCGNCGHVMLFSAIMMGLYTHDQPIEARSEATS